MDDMNQALFLDFKTSLKNAYSHKKKPVEGEGIQKYCTKYT